MRRRMAPLGSSGGWCGGGSGPLRTSRRLRGSWGILGTCVGHRSTAGQVEKAVIPVLHVLEHLEQERLEQERLEQERFTFTSGLGAVARFLLPRLGFRELLFEEGDHVHVDVKRVQS